MYKWKTQARLNGETSNIETDFISYLRGILQGDTLSLILFVLSVNPLPFLLRNHERYKIKNIKKNHNNPQPNVVFAEPDLRSASLIPRYPT